jgi:Tat pathway signal sequence domain protein
MVTSSKDPEVLTGTRGEGISRRKALKTLGFTGLAAVTAACSTSKPELPHEQQ